MTPFEQQKIEEFDWQKWDEIVEISDDMYCHWDEFKNDIKSFLLEKIHQARIEGAKEEKERIGKQIDKSHEHLHGILREVCPGWDNCQTLQVGTSIKESIVFHSDTKETEEI